MTTGRTLVPGSTLDMATHREFRSHSTSGWLTGVGIRRGLQLTIVPARHPLPSLPPCAGEGVPSPRRRLLFPLRKGERGWEIGVLRRRDGQVSPPPYSTYLSLSGSGCHP